MHDELAKSKKAERLSRGWSSASTVVSAHKVAWVERTASGRKVYRTSRTNGDSKRCRGGEADTEEDDDDDGTAVVQRGRREN